MRRLLAISLLLLCSMTTTGVARGNPIDKWRRKNVALLEDATDRFILLTTEADAVMNSVTVLSLNEAENVCPALKPLGKALDNVGAAVAFYDVCQEMSSNRGDLAMLKATKFMLLKWLKSVGKKGTLYAAGIGLIDYSLNQFGAKAQRCLDHKFWHLYVEENLRHSPHQLFSIMAKDGWPAVEKTLDSFWQQPAVDGYRGLPDFKRRNPHHAEVFRNRFVVKYLMKQFEVAAEQHLRKCEEIAASLLAQAKKDWLNTELHLTGSMKGKGGTPLNFNGTIVVKDDDRGEIKRGRFVAGNYRLKMKVSDLINESGSWTYVQVEALVGKKVLARMSWSPDQYIPRKSGNHILVQVPGPEYYDIKAKVSFPGAVYPVGGSCEQIDKGAAEVDFGRSRFYDSKGRVVVAHITKLEQAVTFSVTEKPDPPKKTTPKMEIKGNEGTEELAEKMKMLRRKFQMLSSTHGAAARAAELKRNKLHNEMDKTRDKGRRKKLLAQLQAADKLAQRQGAYQREINTELEKQDKLYRQQDAKVCKDEEKEERAQRVLYEAQVNMSTAAEVMQYGMEDMSNASWRKAASARSVEQRGAGQGKKMVESALDNLKKSYAKYEKSRLDFDKNFEKVNAAPLPPFERTVHSDRVRLRLRTRAALRYGNLEREAKVDKGLGAKKLYEQEKGKLEKLVKVQPALNALVAKTSEAITQMSGVPDKQQIADAAKVIDQSLFEIITEDDGEKALARAVTAREEALKKFGSYLPEEFQKEGSKWQRCRDLLDELQFLDDELGPLVPGAEATFRRAQMEVDKVWMATAPLRKSLAALRLVERAGTNPKERVTACRRLVATAKTATKTSITNGRSGPTQSRFDSLVAAYEKCLAAPSVLVKAERKMIEKEFTSLLKAKDFERFCASRGIVYPVVDKAMSYGPKGQTNYEVSNGVLRIKKEVAQKIPYVLTWVKTKGALTSTAFAYYVVAGSIATFVITNTPQGMPLGKRGADLIKDKNFGLSLPFRGTVYRLLEQLPLIVLEE